MQRLLVGACLLTLTVAFTVRADDDKEKKEEKKVTPKTIFSELVKKFKKEEDPTEKKKLFTTYSQKLVDFAKANSKEDSALEALTLVFQIPVPEGKNNPKEQAVAILTKEYAKSKKIAAVLDDLRGDDEAAMQLLQAILKDNPDKKIQIKACSALIEAKENALGVALGLKNDEKKRASYDELMGKGAAKKILDGADASRKEMEQYIKTLRTDFKVSEGLFIGEKMPELTSEDLEGKKVKLSDIKDKVVVLDIWATWCGPCVAMIPHERELVKKLKDKPFAFVSISFDDEVETVTKFMEKKPMPWTHWFNGRKGSIGKTLNVRYFPTLFILDHKGIVRFKGLRGKAMDSAVDSLLAEMGDTKKPKTE